MNCSQRAASKAEAIRDALRGNRGSAHSWRDFLAGWRVDVWSRAEAAMGEENAGRRAEPDSAGGEFAAGESGQAEYFSRNGKRHEVGCEAEKYLWICGRRSAWGSVDAGGCEPGRHRSRDQHALTF